MHALKSMVSDVQAGVNDPYLDIHPLEGLIADLHRGTRTADVLATTGLHRPARCYEPTHVCFAGITRSTLAQAHAGTRHAPPLESW